MKKNIPLSLGFMLILSLSACQLNKNSSMSVENDLLVNNIFSEKPLEKLKIYGKYYEPLFFIKTKGRDSATHYIVNYLRDDKDIYYLNRDENPIVLVPLKSKNPGSFVPIDWHIGKDKDYVYWTSVKKKVKNPNGFNLINEEIQLYFDGEYYYDGQLKKIDIDEQTFSLVPLTKETKLKNWENYNIYLKSQGLDELAFDSTLQYSPNYALDKNHLYWISNGDVRPLESEEIKEIKESKEYLKMDEDIRVFIEQHPEIKDYEWYKEA